MFESNSRQPVLTYTLIAICVFIALVSNLGENRSVIEDFLISKYVGQGIWFLPEVKSGQYWRLITPIFVHFGIMHIVFNSLWLWELGGAIERTSQTWKLGALVLGIGVALPLGMLLARSPTLAEPATRIVGVTQTIPSIALLAFMIPLFGVGTLPALVALWIYSIFPIVRNTYAGLQNIASEYQETASALGLPRWYRLAKIELPFFLGALDTRLQQIKKRAIEIIATS